MATTTLVPIESGVSAETSAEALGEAIADMAARIHAATYELLVMLREFDARAGWNAGFASCAHWLHWRTGINLGASREKMRVARALADLPRISAAMQRGAISYAKVRALTRAATPETEERLLNLALAGTAMHVERFVGAWRKARRAEAAQQADVRHLNRELALWVDADGMVVIRARLAPEVGAVVQRALEAATDQLYREAAGQPKGEGLTDEATSTQRRADALVRVAEAALAGNLVPSATADRYQVVLHVDDSSPTAVVDVNGHMVDVSAETSRRFGCDASAVVMRHADDGSVFDVGRRTRIVPAPTRRALTSRDGGCRFPGCTATSCDAHHIAHWADGGPTSLENLVLLCRRHHRLVHEGGFSLVRQDDGAVTFFRSDGTVFENAAPLPRVGLNGLAALNVGDIPVWDGTPFDLDWAVSVHGPA